MFAFRLYSTKVAATPNMWAFKGLCREFAKTPGHQSQCALLPFHGFHIQILIRYLFFKAQEIPSQL